MNKKYTVGLFYGGGGAEHQISVLSKRYVKTLLSKTKYDVIDCFVGKNGKIYVDGEVAVPLMSESAILVKGKEIKLDVALPIMHGEDGEDGKVQALFELMRLSYVGCDVTAGAVAFDKVLTKILAQSIGIDTVPYLSFCGCDAITAQEACERRLDYPMFIKPTRQGSSLGAGTVNCKEEFAKAYDLAYHYGSGRVLVEKCILDKRELECAYLAYSDKRYVSEVGEVLSHGFYSFTDKYTKGKTKISTHADIPSAIRIKIRESVITLADTLGIRHLGRFDFFLANDTLYFNEVNTLPGFTRTSLYPRLIEDMGIRLPDMLDSLIADAMSKPDA